MVVDVIVDVTILIEALGVTVTVTTAAISVEVRVEYTPSAGVQTTLLGYSCGDGVGDDCDCGVVDRGWHALARFLILRFAGGSE